MEQEEFSRLLQDYMFGQLSDPDRQRLAVAALESTERAIEFAQVDEIRLSLAEPSTRRDALRMLRAGEAPARVAWWRALVRPQWIVAFAGSAALVVAALSVYDGWSSRAPANVERVAAGSPPAAGRTVPPPSRASEASRGRDSVLRPAGTAVPSTSDMARLFAAPVVGPSSLALAIQPESPVRPGVAMTATVTLPESSRVYAFVRGPEGQLREVYPPVPDEDRVLAAGQLAFSFSAAGRMDPDSGGDSTLRVFVVPVRTGPAPEQDRWQWVWEHALADQAKYTVDVH